MRWAPIILAATLPLASCNIEAPTLPAIPAPWEPTESQSAEPTQPTEAGIPPWVRFGSSVRGKPLEALTLGSGPKRIYIIGGIHGDEPEGPAATGLLPREFMADMVGEAGQKATIRIVRDMNPDGTSAKTRGNTRGTDLDRNWPSKDFRPEALPGRYNGKRPTSELETTAVYDDLKAFKPDLVIIMRTAPLGRGQFIGFDGPARKLAYDFASAARNVDARWRVSVLDHETAPGSVNSLVGHDMGKPILTMWFQRGHEVATSARSIRAGVLAIAGEAARK